MLLIKNLTRDSSCQPEQTDIAANFDLIFHYILSQTKNFELHSLIYRSQNPSLFFRIGLVVFAIACFRNFV